MSLGIPSPAGLVGVGIDAVEISRMRHVLARRPALAARIFTEAEQAYAATFGTDPAPRFAARFAAKEATMKALGSGLGSFALTDVEVVASEDPESQRGAPALLLHRAAADLARRRHVARWHLSITHTAEVAMAVVVAEAGALS
jgi:holo-[acyl-carrier protein] synthase